MALKSKALFLTFCLVSSVSLGLARRSQSMSPRPSKTIRECYDAFFYSYSCLGEILRAVQGGKIESRISTDCCKAILGVGSGCLPKLIPISSQRLEDSCSRMLTAPPPPFEDTSVPNSMGPSIMSSAPIGDAPIGDVPVVSPPDDALSPMVEEPFMNSPGDEGLV